MQGINAETGKDMEGLDHLKQSIRDILSTRIGTRVMRRDYGSDIPNLIDAPMNRKTFGDIFAAAATALDKWEPRLRLTQINVSQVTKKGTLTLALEGVYLGRRVSLTTDIVTLT